MRTKHHNVALIDKYISQAVDMSGDYYLSKALANRHHKVNTPAWATNEISMRCVSLLADLSLRLERLCAEPLRERMAIAGDRENEFSYLNTQVKAVQTTFTEAISALVAGHVLANVVADATEDKERPSNIGFVHNAISHGLRKAHEFHMDHHREFSVRPVLSRYKNAMKCVIDGKFIDAIRDVTITVYMTELDLDNVAPLSLLNPVNLTGDLAAYVGE